MISLDSIEPSDLGFPEKFEAFRPGQLEAAEELLNSNVRFLGFSKPTGAGKTLAAMLMAKVTGRAAILTSSKGLQSQYTGDFNDAGLVDIRGKSNYSCAGVPTLSCRFGPHEGCPYKGGVGCTYETARDTAKAASIVVTNYSYWIRANERQKAIEIPDNPFKLLILDEGHKASEELARSIKTSLRETWLRTAGVRYENQDELTYWQKLAFANIEHVNLELKAAILQLKRSGGRKLIRDRVYELEELKESFERICQMQPDQWVCEIRQGTHGRIWEFDCVWPGQWAERRLFQAIPKVVILSATLRPMALSMLGIAKKDYKFMEWPKVFPSHHTPIYFLPTVKMNYQIDEEGLQKWVKRVDEIIQKRVGRKGIIHTVSFQRQKYLLAHSKHAKYFICNSNEAESELASDVVQRFKTSSAPSILVSPSFSTGWDFPGDECLWQIVTKVPYPDPRSKVMQARTIRNPQYPSYLAMIDIVQAAGRGTRTALDRCEIFIIDSSFEYFWKLNRGLAPKWFNPITISVLPPPMALPQKNP
jgi:ATP-dependent DNA helicase DinG